MQPKLRRRTETELRSPAAPNRRRPQVISLVPTEIVELPRLEVELTNEEILADLLYPEPLPRPQGPR